MGLTKLCTVSELAEGEMRDFQVDGKELVVTWCEGEQPAAFDAACPHEGISLAFGDFDGRHLVCGAHMWSFDAATGEGVFPGDCSLRRRPLRIEGADVFIDLQDESVPTA
jgi:toluene monooxygenase system ferredoxin subunit